MSQQPPKRNKSNQIHVFSIEMKQSAIKWSFNELFTIDLLLISIVKTTTKQTTLF